MQGFDGFLGTRASFMLDVVSLAMVVILPILAWSVFQVRFRRRYLLHKRTQLTLGIVLLATVALFEADMRINGWRQRAEASAYASPEGTLSWIDLALGVHLCFSISTGLLWIVVIARALANFPNPPMPAPHSGWHVPFARLAACDMVGTAVSGWVFYYLAFVA